MLKSKFHIAIVLVVSLVSCQSNKSELISVEVNNSGALRTIMSGDVSSAISLDSLQSKEHLFALGAMENLKGEIQIFDGNPSNSSVVNDSIKITDTYNQDKNIKIDSNESRMFKFYCGKRIGSISVIVYELYPIKDFDAPCIWLIKLPLFRSLCYKLPFF